MNRDSIASVYLPDVLKVGKQLKEIGKARTDLLTPEQIEIDDDQFNDRGKHTFDIFNFPNFTNDPEGSYRFGESPSAACYASAEGLAKLGGYMANRGTF